MQDEKPIDGADGEVERALMSLRPRLPSIDRDRLLFSAGFQAAHRKIWIWRSAAGSLAAMLLVSVFVRPQAPQTRPIRGNGSSNSMLVVTTQKSPTAPAPIEIVSNRWLEIIWSISKDPAESPPPDNFLAMRRATQNGAATVPIPAGNGQEPALLFDPRLADPADQSVYQLMKRGGQSL
jgi:hypothetical protein